MPSRRDFEPRRRRQPLPERDLFPSDIGTALPRPSMGPKTSFRTVIDARRSTHSTKPLTRRDLSTLLWHAARVRSLHIRKDGLKFQSRPAPSAGGLHPIHLVIARCAGSPGCAFRYDPLRHALAPLAITSRALSRWLTEVDAVAPGKATIVALLCDEQRTAERYVRSNSLTWRDAGCQLALLHVVATWLTLNSSLLGIEGQSLAAAVHPRLRGMGMILVGRT